MGEEERGFRIVDRRAGGDPPQGEAGSQAEGGARAGESPAPPAAENEPEAPAASLPALDFSTFILSLSTSGFYHLGLVPDPQTREPAPANLVLARQTIDTLEILQHKTRGNLEPDEAHLLESLLYELRIRFVEKRG
ncbi:hypothetical protein MYXO_04000 [Myxococcaceae bacterium]|jgi:hypothetical protein|nr:hypothetical protein MYXO_04000 [Myxococcaceae bacterium]